MQKVMPPSSLKTLQRWFSSIITRPIREDSSTEERAPSGELLKEEAPHYIRPSKMLQPHERINLYNQQYYWRLINAMQDNFPLLLRLFGYADFNNLIAVPFLTQHPPKKWSLATLGDELTLYLKNEYQEPDRLLILDVAELDMHYCQGFIAKTLPRLSSSDFTSEEELLSKTLYLQPHAFIKSYSYELLPFRDAMLKESPDHWMETNFPLLKKQETCHYLLYRDADNQMCWRTLSQEEMELLRQFEKGASLASACEGLPPTVESKVGEWFRLFGALGLFTCHQ